MTQNPNNLDIPKDSNPHDLATFIYALPSNCSRIWLTLDREKSTGVLNSWILHTSEEEHTQWFAQQTEKQND